MLLFVGFLIASLQWQDVHRLPPSMPPDPGFRKVDELKKVDFGPDTELPSQSFEYLKIRDLKPFSDDR